MRMVDLCNAYVHVSMPIPVYACTYEYMDTCYIMLHIYLAYIHKEYEYEYMIGMYGVRAYLCARARGAVYACNGAVWCGSIRCSTVVAPFGAVR